LCLPRGLSFLPHTCYMPLPFHYFDLITRTILGEEYRSWSPSLRSFLHSPVNSSLLDANILPNSLFSNTLSLCSSLNRSDQVSHTHTHKIFLLYSKTYINISLYLSVNGINFFTKDWKQDVPVKTS
jgi:hypothetical protein